MKQRERSVSILLLTGFLFCAAPAYRAVPQAAPQNPAELSAPPSSADRLHAALDAVLDVPELAGSFTGVCVVRIRDNQILYARDAERVFLPASNNKLLTSFAACETLASDFAYHTRVFTQGTRDESGVLHGDLVLAGGGDPILTLADLDDLAQRVMSAGVRDVRGMLRYDDTRFDRQWLGDGWTWDDEAAAYSAQISALNVNANCVSVQVLPGKKIGDRARVQVTPALRDILIENTATTGAAKQPSTLVIDRARGRNVIVVTGTLPRDTTPKTQPAVEVTIEDPARFTASLFLAALRKAGVHVAGGKGTPQRIIDRPASPASPSIANSKATPPIASEPDSEADLVAEHVSPPLPELLRRMNKPSDNLMAECLLKAVGAYGTFPPRGLMVSVPRRTGTGGSGGTGAQTARQTFAAAGLNLNGVRQVDGSGLSRGNYVSPHNLARLLVYAHSRPYFPALYASLPVAGVDGTLRNRMKNTPAQSNCHAKTGSLSHVSNLSGYVTDAAGEELAFSILINNHLGAARACTLAQDKIVELLVGYGGASAPAAPKSSFNSAAPTVAR